MRRELLAHVLLFESLFYSIVLCAVAYGQFISMPNLNELTTLYLLFYLKLCYSLLFQYWMLRKFCVIQIGTFSLNFTVFITLNVH